jgi:hypothetical protein
LPTISTKRTKPNSLKGKKSLRRFIYLFFFKKKNKKKKVRMRARNRLPSLLYGRSSVKFGQKKVLPSSLEML